MSHHKNDAAVAVLLRDGAPQSPVLSAKEGDDLESPPLHHGADDLRAAVAAEKSEKDMTLWTALRVYRGAVGWSMGISLALIMEGYDLSLINASIATPAFRKKYGYGAGAGGTKGFQLTPAWQSAIGQAPSVGAVLGILITSYCQDRWGYRRTLQACLVLVTAFIFIVFFAPSVEVFFIGEFLRGFAWGAFSTSAVSYATDDPHQAARVSHDFIASMVVYGVTLPRSDEWAPKVVRKGRLAGAERAVDRLAGGVDGVSPSETVAMMVRTNEIEKETTAGTSYLECFKRPTLRRTEIAFGLTIGLRMLAMLGTLGSWVAMIYFGRRQLYLFGLSVDGIILLVRILSATSQHTASKWAQGGLIMVWVFVWDLAVTVIAYPIVGEMSSTRLRAKSVGLARIFYQSAIAAGIINAYSLNPTAWNWKGKSAFLWLGTCVCALVWTYFRLPEAKDRSWRELDILFERRVPARKFKTTVVGELEEK
ncbi:hypothetical protein Q8F55_005365 [Vanrija albida]|uniref:Major facilitator superfamily (MFS) profile domain-containing protein n=1 Tax=Vanrija albida TaxID=181172 RepID=A0ABR3Q1P6_9TREE